VYTSGSNKFRLVKKNFMSLRECGQRSDAMQALIERTAEFKSNKQEFDTISLL